MYNVFNCIFKYIVFKVFKNNIYSINEAVRRMIRNCCKGKSLRFL